MSSNANKMILPGIKQYEPERAIGPLFITDHFIAYIPEQVGGPKRSRLQEKAFLVIAVIVVLVIDSLLPFALWITGFAVFMGVIVYIVLRGGPKGDVAYRKLQEIDLDEDHGANAWRLAFDEIDSIRVKGDEIEIHRKETAETVVMEYNMEAEWKDARRWADQKGVRWD